MLNTINLKSIKEMLVKYDELLEKGNLDTRKEYRELLKNYLKENFEKACDTYITDVKINRDSYGFTLYTFDKHTDKEQYIKVTFIAHSKSCKIIFDGKFSIDLKY
jgi:hypothetical protein